MQTARLDEAQAGNKTAGKSINKLRYAQIYHPNGRKWTKPKELLDEGKRGEWKSWLKTQHSENQDHSIWSHNFKANRWETMETVTDFLFLGSKITADGDCSHGIKRCLILRRRATTNLDSVLKSRDITLLTKVHLIKAIVFSNSHVWMWVCTIKKAERQRIDDFELWCWAERQRIDDFQLWCWAEWQRIDDFQLWCLNFSQQSCFQLELHPTWQFAWCTLPIS